VQGDEPLIDPATIDAAVNALVEDATAQMSTTFEAIENTADVLNPSVVKIAFDEDAFATNFSRNPIPYPSQAVEKYGSLEAALRQEPALLFSFKKHTGLYAYRRDFLLEFTRWPQSERESKESLEQLRALDRGVKIKVVEAATPSIGVDTEDDLERVRAIMSEPPAVADGQTAGQR
jgi:3-deoxy-manno-octulosonate cytidylyltransferase (CMP-KDO synthetase)